jgi:hypothetical protein
MPVNVRSTTNGVVIDRSSFFPALPMPARLPSRSEIQHRDPNHDPALDMDGAQTARAVTEIPLYSLERKAATVQGVVPGRPRQLSLWSGRGVEV